MKEDVRNMERQVKKDTAEYRGEKYVILDRMNRASRLIPLDENVGNGATPHVDRTF